MQRHSLARRLLDYAARGFPPPSAWRFASPPADDASERELRWVLDAGLGPLLYRVFNKRAGCIPAPWREVALSADLTARVRHGCLVATALEVIAACREMGVLPVLLKGISTSDELYPDGHLRPMGDVDVLVHEAVCQSVQSRLVRLGFVPTGTAAWHHDRPLYHPHFKVWVEIHSKLFGPSSRLDTGNAFSKERLFARTVPSTFHGQDVGRFAPELELPYMASTLMANMIFDKVEPSHLPTLIDIVVLLATKGQDIDWARMEGELDNPMARASTYVTLSFLASRGLARIPLDTLARLQRKQNVVGRIQTACIHEVVERYLIGGHRWSHFLPPPVPGRYGVRFQLEKRILARLKRRGEA